MVLQELSLKKFKILSYGKGRQARRNRVSFNRQGMLGREPRKWGKCERSTNADFNSDSGQDGYGAQAEKARS